MEVRTEDYVAQLKELLPPGLAFPRGDSTSLYALLIEVWAMEFVRADGRANQLIEEADPRTAVESFQEWLTQWGIPDECMTLWQEVGHEDLRPLLLWKIADQGNPTPRFFIDLAAMFGYLITIDEFNRFRVTSRVTDVLASETWPNTWRVNVLAPKGIETHFHKVTGEAKEPLAWWGDSLIACLIRRYAPAHTIVYIAFWNDDEEK